MRTALPSPPRAPPRRWRCRAPRRRTQSMLATVDKTYAAHVGRGRRRDPATSGRSRPGGRATTRRRCLPAVSDGGGRRLLQGVGRRADAAFGVLHRDRPRYPRADTRHLGSAASHAAVPALAGARLDALRAGAGRRPDRYDGRGGGRTPMATADAARRRAPVEAAAGELLGIGARATASRPGRRSRAQSGAARRRAAAAVLLRAAAAAVLWTTASGLLRAASVRSTAD